MLNIKKFNVRLSALFVSAVVLFVTVFSLSSSQKVEAGDITLSYNAHDARTGAYLRTYSLTVEGTKTRDVIGTDEREIDFSKNGVVKIITNYSMSTGFVVDEHTIATTMHSVYNQAIESILLFDKDGNNTMTITDPVEYHFPVNYLSFHSVDFSNPYDYALITVKQSLKDYQCFDLGMVTESFKDKPNNVVSVAGFSGLTHGNTGGNNYETHRLYRGTGHLTNSHAVEYDYIDLIDYDADASSGASGGPIYVSEEIAGQLYCTVIGIHAYGSGTNPPDVNTGVAISPHVLKFLKGNSNKNY